MISNLGSPPSNNVFTEKQTFNGSATNEAVALKNTTELVNIVTETPGATIDFYVASGSVQYYTNNAGSDWTLNIAFSESTSLDTAMSIGDSITITLLTTQGSTAYYESELTIDGISVAPNWLGGPAPTSGNASGIDVYTYTIIKTASSAYTVLASQTRAK